jgi:hypothetical protein
MGFNCAEAINFATEVCGLSSCALILVHLQTSAAALQEGLAVCPLMAAGLHHTCCAAGLD